MIASQYVGARDRRDIVLSSSLFLVLATGFALNKEDESCISRNGFYEFPTAAAHNLGPAASRGDATLRRRDTPLRRHANSGDNP